ncbi:RrF2 family transcriptional regulator [Saccharothrix australiensis]|uniref:BadM/Rrf2 family transcriptional regulator n=1 Tax=Saccharothrix australiensis TaxID=2072 RepID=A0A495W295_9PSEU|nr:Rrf2 family transcriptional regulator [Saccharothrix australiensis]RKT55260.1 BadM/Rrf2 family transcriptional regulator [Saccharothrix australiensis]
MHLLRSTDIALRVVMLLASGDGRLTVDQLSAALGVPRNHLAKVVQRLQRNGFVATTRGRDGGVGLPDGAAATSVGAVVRALEGDGEVVDCEGPPCPLRGGCHLRGALRTAQLAFLAALDAVTVGELLAEPAGPVLLDLVPGPRRPGGTP